MMLALFVHEPGTRHLYTSLYSFINRDPFKEGGFKGSKGSKGSQGSTTSSRQAIPFCPEPLNPLEMGIALFPTFDSNI